ncbi:MAG TPA: FAD-dependent monooxygenase [Nonomuraea sp.]|nr:FAD-dependent monooxygenase [Nonomuraea sp.]
MKVACVGGGPASLYFSILMKRVDPSHDITVYERNPAGSTYGWGVTYWDDLFNDLHAADPESAREISGNSVSWVDWVVHVRDRATVTVQRGSQGFGIGRQTLLDILAERARSLGVRVEYERVINHEDELPDADLVVAGDGINSGLRERHTEDFGTEVAVGRNPFMWLGTTKIFDAFTFAFVDTPHGWIWLYGYGFSKEHSTCVVECFPETWRGLGFDRSNEADSLAVLEKLFADVLDGNMLIGRAQDDGTAHWQTFRTLTNRTWHRGRVALIGDAAHTTHYSVGAGTALAFGDAAGLVDSLYRAATLEDALAHYGKARRTAIRPAQRAAHYSARWYENLRRYIDLPTEQMFALLGQRHSGLLAHMPPRMFYRLDRAAERLDAVLSRRRRGGGH